MKAWTKLKRAAKFIETAEGFRPLHAGFASISTSDDHWTAWWMLCKIPVRELSHDEREQLVDLHATVTAALEASGEC